MVRARYGPVGIPERSGGALKRQPYFGTTAIIVVSPVSFIFWMPRRLCPWLARTGGRRRKCFGGVDSRRALRKLEKYVYVVRTWAVRGERVCYETCGKHFAATLRQVALCVTPCMTACARREGERNEWPCCADVPSLKMM